MTNKEILENAVRKASLGGYNANTIDDIWEAFQKYDPEMVIFYIIFGHDFAKAFWGCEDVVDRYTMEAWEYHLQQMILEENPLTYLEKFL